MKKKIQKKTSNAERRTPNIEWRKSLILLVLMLMLVPVVQAGDPGPPVSATTKNVVEPPAWVNNLAGNLFAAKAAAFTISPALQGKRTGFGLAVLYPVSEYAFAGVRLDYFDGGFTAPSAIVGAKYTLKEIMFKPTVFSYGGLIMAVGGANEENHVVAATTGIGASGMLWQSKNGHFSLNAYIAAEKWTNFTEPVIRPGLIFAGSF